MLRKKSPVTRPGIDPGTFRLVAQRLNHYATPDPLTIIENEILYNYKNNIFFKERGRANTLLVDQVVDGEVCGAVPRHVPVRAQRGKDKEHKVSAAKTVRDPSALQLCVALTYRSSHQFQATYTSPPRLYRSRRVVMLTVPSEG